MHTAEAIRTCRSYRRTENKYIVAHLEGMEGPVGAGGGGADREGFGGGARDAAAGVP